MWMQRMRFLSVGALMLAATVALAGCGGTSTTTSQSGSSGQTASSSAKVPTKLVVDQSGAPATLDPGLQWDTESYQVYRNIFDELVARSPTTGKIEPSVAVSWTNPSPTVWKFKIRSGIKFSNGEPLTAADVAFSLNRILNPSLRSAQASNYSQVKSAVANGDTVTITTKVPDPTLLSYLHILSIVPEQYVKKHGKTYFNLHPIGSGPYEVKQWVQGSKVILVRNPNYWGKKPIFKTVVFRSVPNEATRVADLQSGVADLATDISPDQVATIKGNSNLQVLAAPEEFVQLLLFNAYEAPTNSADFRKAVAYAINKKLLIKTVMRGYAKPVKEPLAPGVFGYNPSIPGFPYNPAKAKNLLKKANYSGQPVVILTSPVFSTTLLQAIQNELHAVGINAKIKSYAGPAYLEKWQGKKHNWGNLNVTDWSCSCEDASGTLFPLFTAGSIWSSYSNPALNKAIIAAQSTVNRQDRIKDFNQALTLIQAQAPGIGLWQLDAIYGANKHLVYKPDLPQDMFVSQMGWQ